MRILAAVLGFVVSFGLAMTAMAQPLAVNPNDIADVLKTLKAPGATESPIVFQSEEGFLRFLSAPPGAAFSSRAPSGKAAGPAGYATNFVEDHRGAFGVDNAQVTISSKKVRAQDSYTYVRFSQRYKNIPVFGAEMVVQVDDVGGVHAVASEVLRDMRALDHGEVALTPGIDTVVAINKAKMGLSQALGTVDADELSAQGDLELMLFQPSLAGLQGTTRLTWRVRLMGKGTGNDSVAEEVFVDAQNGQLCFHYSLIKQGKERAIYDCENTYNVPSTPTREEGDPATEIADVDNAYDYFGDTYDFYYREHGRDSYDDEGGLLKAFVRQPFENAYWESSGKRMVFGTGFTVDDVTAHEMTHAVTDTDINLLYFGESGALSESFSDIWGEYVDLTNARGTDTEAVRWLMGEDLPQSYFDRYYPDATVPGIRSMKDPTLFGDPDKYTSPYFKDTTSFDDNGGVHSNSGVGNKLCYLLTDGDTFNGQTVRGMGISRAADLFYGAMQLLPSLANYEMFYLALGASGSALGLSLEDRLNIAKAGRAVEIEPAEVQFLGLRGLRATPAWDAQGNAVIAVNWSPPPADEYSKVILVRSLGGYVDMPSQGQELFSGQGDRYLDSDVQSGVEYFYTLFADLNIGLPQVAYARAVAGSDPSETLSEAFLDVVGGNKIDLAFSQILFTPVGPPAAGPGASAATVGYDSYEATIAHQVYSLPVARTDAQGGAQTLTLMDDSVLMINSGEAAFPYFGKRYSTLYVGANGYIAFQDVGTTSLLNFPALVTHFAIPRISFLFADLAPSIGGDVWVRGLADRMVVTFEHVPEFAKDLEGVITDGEGEGEGDGTKSISGTISGNTVQLELFYSGHIRMTFQELVVEAAGVGLSDGNDVPIDPADLFEGLRSVELFSNLSELPETPSRISVEPVTPVQVDAGELIQFVVQTQLPFGETAIPLLTAEWDRSVSVPFADNGNGTGTFVWQTTLSDTGVYTLRVRAILGEDSAYQDIRIGVGSANALPEAFNLSLSSDTPLENPMENRIVALGRPLMADWDYRHPQLEQDPSRYAEGDSILYWFRNYQLISGLINARIVPPSALKANDVWYFMVIPKTVNDVTGEQVTSPVVTIAGMPKLTSISPVTGSMEGGETVVIRGSRLNGALTVSFGGVDAADIRVISDSEIEVVTPLHPVGTVDVVVTTVSGSSRLSYAYEFYDPAEGEGEPDEKEGAFLMCAGDGTGAAWGSVVGDLILAGLMCAGLCLSVRRFRARESGR